MRTTTLNYTYIAACLCFAALTAQANQPAAPIPPQPQPPAAVFPLTNPNCFSYRTSLPGAKIYFDKKNIIYALINTGVRDKINFEMPLYKHVVAKINMKENSLIIIKELTASMPRGVLFMPSGNPPSSWSGALFEGEAHLCRYGKVRFFSSYPRNDKKISAFEKEVALVTSSRNPRMFDIASRRMLSADVSRFQFRKLLGTVPVGELPLFSDPQRRILYTFTESPSFRGIINRSTRNDKRLNFPVGSRVLQQGQAFALSTVNRANNIMEIKEFPQWSGIQAKRKRYRIKLPQLYSFNEAQAKIDFRKKIIAIGGSNLLTKRKWGKVFFIDYRRGKQLAVLDVETQMLADTIAIDPFGLYIAINVVRVTDGKTAYLALFDLTKRKLHKISLRPTVRRYSK